MKLQDKYLPPIKPHGPTCNCCNSVGHELPLETVLYNGFGGWSIFRNGEHFFTEDTDKEWEDFKTLFHFEQLAKENPDDDWRAVCYTPLHGETYQRQDGKWVLVEQNEGFA